MENCHLKGHANSIRLQCVPPDQVTAPPLYEQREETSRFKRDPGAAKQTAHQGQKEAENSGRKEVRIQAAGGGRFSTGARAGGWTARTGRVPGAA
jgi:hypothetical protein